MEEVRQLVQEEGREARNLVAFHVAVDPPSRVSRKPPRAGPPPRRPTPRPAARLRSASAGRDKRSELRARYWALLFGDLQRAIGEIYNTVEAHESLSECQEVILVLENYTRDFKALCEWFRLKWELDNTPPPQRPLSLAWEIRKTDFVRPESRRAYSVKSSPSVSGKNSPSLSGTNTPSGKNSPNLTGKASPGSGKISPRNAGLSNITSPKGNIEFFSNKITAKITAKPEPKNILELSRLSDIKEKEVNNISEDTNVPNKDVDRKILEEDQSNNPPTVEMGKAKECPNTSPKMVVIKSPKRAILPKDSVHISSDDNVCSQAKATIAKLDAMENEFLTKNLTENTAKNENLLNLDKEIDSFDKTEVVQSESLGHKPDNKSPTDDKESTATESPVKSEDNFGDVSNESSCKSLENDEKAQPKNETPKEDNEIETVSASLADEDSSILKVTEINQAPENLEVVDTKGLPLNISNTEAVKDSNDKEELKDNVQNEIKEVKKDIKTVSEKIPTRPAYSQAAAKPKPVIVPKPEPKTQTRLARSKTVVEIRPASSQKPVNRSDPRGRNKTNKCSYPFNLTTGRTSLFDTPNKANLSKKPANRMQQIGSGDNKNLLKLDTHVRSRPPRPNTLKINEKGDKKDNSNIALENIKDCDEYGSSDTLVTDINVCRIESSESLKTLVPDGGDVGDFSEILDIDKIKNDDDGWLTVKSRRLSRESKKQSKSHWGNRFHQPSATTSLPTLNMIESPKQEIKDIIANSKLDRAKSEQPQHMPPQKSCTSQKTFQPPKEQQIAKTQETRKPDELISTHHDKPKEAAKSQETIKSKESFKSNGLPKAKSEVRDTKKDLAMIRQKSDVTGLKTRSSRSKALKKEKVKDTPKSDGSELTKNRLHSSLESLTTGLARSQESTQEIFDFDKWKEEFKTTFKFLEDDDQMPNHNEILKSADPSEMSEIAEMTSLIEENERKISWALDFQSEVDQRKLCEEEDLLNRQIMELQQVSDVDLDTETDDTETDAEILCEDKSVSKSPSTENLTSLTASLEDQYETALAGMSWAERVDTLGALEALVARDPGRAQQLHAKLSQGIKRRGSLQDALRRLQAKQARAERQRIEYQTERARKIHQLLAKVEEVKVAKNQLIEEKRLRMERRLQKAAENRDQHLKDIVRKAHDEEEKLREIAFIKQLEAENRRHEFLDQCRSHTSRLRLMRRDRLSKLEQKAAREAAVGARRQALEAARKLHVETLLEKRKERDARVEELKELKKQERDDAAREKAEGVKSRLSALAAAASQEADALRERIRDKQDASQLRLESHLQAIREKATGPRQATTSESQDQSSKEEKELQEEAERLEQERKDREKQKAIKRKARKMKQKLLTTTCEDTEEKDTVMDNKHPQVARLCKVINQIQYTLSPLITTIQTENKTNGCASDETEKKKNKKNKKIVSEAAEKEPECNSNNKEVEKKPESDSSNTKVEKKLESNDNNTKVEKKLESNDNNKKVEKKLESNNNKKVQKKPETNDNDKEIEKISESNTNTSNKKVDNKSKSSNNNKENQEETKTEGKKKKKKNDKGGSKLSKSGSICSSHSDMSKASAKGKRLEYVIDMQHFERQLNELLRIVEKFDKTAVVSKDRTEQQNLKIVKVISGFLGVAADREEFGVHVSTRSVHTSVTLLSRLVSMCGHNSARILSGTAAVHLIVLLYNQIEKGMSDSKEMDVVKDLTDCLSVALDSVLNATRVYVNSTGDPPENLEGLAALRTRSHNLISFLCLSGCVSIAESSANLIAMDGMHNLLTVCGNLCHVCDLDVGPERASAVQSFKVSLGTSICGARGLFCMLFAQGVVLEKSEHFVRAARTIHLLKTVAELDHQIIQESFGEGGWPLEFRAAVARLLSQHAPNDKEAPRTRIRWHDESLEDNLVETMVLDLIVLVGFVVVNNPQLQETICEGWSVIKTLCTLPANWLVSRYHSHMLVPTLVALSQHKGAAAAIGQELSGKILDDYMKSPVGNRIKLVQVITQGRPKKGKK